MNSNSINTRNQTIIRCNTEGILLNLLLSVAKGIIGFMIHSRAVILDAVNGFSELLSSLISIISTLYASRHSDPEHPFGYGRLEYLSSMFTTVLIIFMGLQAAWGAVKEILHPDGAPQYNIAVIMLMILSLICKVIYGYRARRTGKAVNSTALIMTGSDSIGDALVDVSILIAIIVYNALKIDLEPWLSLLISILLIKTGVEMIRECANKLLGSRADPELIRNVKRQAARVPGVRSVFNLVIHNYGEGVLVGSVDIAVDNSMSVEESTGLVRKIKRRSEELGVRMASVGVYGISLSNPDHAVMWDQILSAVGAHPEFARAYAFSYDAEENTAYFIVTMSTNARNDTDAVRRLSAELEQRFPGISFSIDMSVDT